MDGSRKEKLKKIKNPINLNLNRQYEKIYTKLEIAIKCNKSYMIEICKIYS